MSDESSVSDRENRDVFYEKISDKKDHLRKRQNQKGGLVKVLKLRGKQK